MINEPNIFVSNPYLKEFRNVHQIIFKLYQTFFYVKVSLIFKLRVEQKLERLKSKNDYVFTYQQTYRYRL